MEKLFILIVAVLFILAISDLIVGVSNDAVNFLNSAIGAKVASLRIILAVAAAGVLVGATFSSGMMEVARKGIFYPESFSFYNIMIIFLAVMLTDVILLDLFNTFGLPTSTTVSIVFELLGAAVGIAIVTIINKGEELNMMGSYINSGKALAIISGILLSVAIAFTVGAFIQYLSRLLFSFNYTRTIKYFGAIWGGIAITSITYFILIKGAKGASFMTDENVNWIKTHTMLILTGSMITWTFILQLLNWIFNFNVLKFIVFAGTFALAMAFAGNDLVNFIGVPLAGFESFRIFSEADGADPNGFLMSSLAGKVKTPTMYLLIAGLIMVITLWLSKKARSVVKTTLNLSDQNQINERFESSIIARSIVRQAVILNKGIQTILPSGILKWAEKRFDPAHYKEYLKKNPGVSFDLIRASVNLVVASILIAFATSLKLPLSTTYVTFMVAMGSSLADGAWGRESAVYRITGVVTVVGGWFFTAFSAFTVSLLVALILYWSNLWGLAALIPLAAFLVIKTHAFHNRKEVEASKERKKAVTIIDGSGIYENCSEQVSGILLATYKTFNNSVEFLICEKRKKMKENVKNVKELNKHTKKLKKDIPGILQVLREESFEGSHNYIEIIDYLRETMHCMTHIVNPAFKHIDNNHKPLSENQAKSLTELGRQLKTYITNVVDAASEGDFTKSEKTIASSQEIVNEITRARKKQLKLIKSEPGSTRTNMLYMDILSETKNLVLHVNNIYKSFRDFSEINKKEVMSSGFSVLN
ncbi:MAG: inorganic phosphate transporter [Bacteroidales bacterium]|nr:inorganic phosphate transporter [Bacteroidales bacterium]